MCLKKLVTPETFTGDFLDAMALSTLTGRCWQALTATVPGFRSIPDEREDRILHAALAFLTLVASTFRSA